MKRFEIVLSRHGLSPDDYETAKPIFSSKTPQDVLRNAKKVLRKFSRGDVPYHLKMFIDAVTISAETDMDDRWNG